jgi:hypothetical protein
MRLNFFKKHASKVNKSIMNKVSSRKFFRAIAFLFTTGASRHVFFLYIKDYFCRVRNSNNSQNQVKGIFSTDWFSGNIPHWNLIFDKYFEKTKIINSLEIGSWEGRSSLFILENLPMTTLTCVDTWGGADEHQDLINLSSIENLFDSNTKAYSNRLKKFKGTSFKFFNTYSEAEKFDLIYIDGSHFVNDVLIDALKGFEHLNVGGIMIFDDYFWDYYPDPFLNPAAAINCFINLKKDYLRIESVYAQLVIQKIAYEIRN